MKNFQSKSRATPGEELGEGPMVDRLNVPKKHGFTSRGTIAEEETQVGNVSLKSNTRPFHNCSVFSLNSTFLIIHYMHFSNAFFSQDKNAILSRKEMQSSSYLISSPFPSICSFHSFLSSSHKSKPPSKVEETRIRLKKVRDSIRKNLEVVRDCLKSQDYDPSQAADIGRSLKAGDGLFTTDVLRLMDPVTNRFRAHCGSRSQQTKEAAAEKRMVRWFQVVSVGVVPVVWKRADTVELLGKLILEVDDIYNTLIKNLDGYAAGVGVSGRHEFTSHLDTCFYRVICYRI